VFPIEIPLQNLYVGSFGFLSVYALIGELVRNILSSELLNSLTSLVGLCPVSSNHRDSGVLTIFSFTLRSLFESIAWPDFFPKVCSTLSRAVNVISLIISLAM
jgi:fucose permease